MKCLILLCIMLLSFSCSSKNEVENEDTNTQQENWQKYPAQGELKIMSFNVRLGTAKENDPQNGWDFRKAACVAMIRDHKASAY